MAAHLIGQAIVHVPEILEPYVRETSAIIARYGGEVLDVVQAIETVEGS
jgi:uncharacterized protein (DUF1330 family)